MSSYHDSSYRNYFQPLSWDGVDDSATTMIVSLLDDDVDPL